MVNQIQVLSVLREMDNRLFDDDELDYLIMLVEDDMLRMSQDVEKDPI